MSARDEYPRVGGVTNEDQWLDMCDEIDEHRAQLEEVSTTYNRGWKDALTVVGNIRDADYERQDFSEALSLAVSLRSRGKLFSEIIELMQLCGVLRNNVEVHAYDAWEQRPR